jgi:hypothetical protein
MVAALFEGDINYAVTVFGKPRSLEAVTVPNNYSLPNDVINCVDVDFIFYPNVELFRVFRFGQGSSSAVLFSLQTHAFSLNSGRPKTFIGAGIFARSGVDPEALVKALRDLLKGAQKALLKDGKFIVESIGAHEKRLLSIPESVDLARSPHAAWFSFNAPQPAKHILIKSTKTGVDTPEQFFERVLSFPGAFGSNTFFCLDERVINDCRARSDEFEVMSSTSVFERASLTFANLQSKQSQFINELKIKNQEISYSKKNRKLNDFDEQKPQNLVKNNPFPFRYNVKLDNYENRQRYDDTQQKKYYQTRRSSHSDAPAWLPYVKTLLIVFLIFALFGAAYLVVNQLVHGNFFKNLDK